jgi:hypothetical protein
VLSFLVVLGLSASIILGAARGGDQVLSLCLCKAYSGALCMEDSGGDTAGESSPPQDVSRHLIRKPDGIA